MKKKNIAYLYVSLTVILWGSSAAVGDLLLTRLNNLQVLFYSFLITTISLFIIVLLKKKLAIVKKYKLKDYWHFAYMGFVGVFLYYIFFFGSLMFAPSQEAFIINYTWPIWVVIFSTLLLKEKFNHKKFIAILMGFIGVYVVVTKGFSLSITNIKGDILALLGGISYGLFSVLGKKFDYDRFVSMMFYYMFSFIFILPTVLLFSEIPILTAFEWIGIMWFGIFLGGLAFVFWFLSLKYGDTAKMSNIVFLTPFVSLIYIALLVGERILITSVIGLIIIVSGIFVQQYKRK